MPGQGKSGEIERMNSNLGFASLTDPADETLGHDPDDRAGNEVGLNPHIH